tara:strand:+ start:39 stop:263 length:225 start_codon:yes stop_codon:yes gene_type:complete
MKKILLIPLLFLAGCVTLDTVYPTPKKCLSNLELLEKWIEYDVENGLINEEIAADYLLIIRSTQIGLQKQKLKR